MREDDRGKPQGGAGRREPGPHQVPELLPEGPPGREAQRGPAVCGGLVRRAGPRLGPPPRAAGRRRDRRQPVGRHGRRGLRGGGDVPGLHRHGEGAGGSQGREELRPGPWTPRRSTTSCTSGPRRRWTPAGTPKSGTSGCATPAAGPPRASRRTSARSARPRKSGSRSSNRDFLSGAPIGTPNIERRTSNAERRAGIRGNPRRALSPVCSPCAADIARKAIGPSFDSGGPAIEPIGVAPVALVRHPGEKQAGPVQAPLGFRTVAPRPRSEPFRACPVAISRGRSGRGSSPCSTPRRSRARTSPARPRWRRPPPGPGAGSSSRRPGRRACRST